ncbi:unnamed protein product, partial [Amoebophrya sp. A25]|eukprot:GSA25T00026001001.1
MGPLFPVVVAFIIDRWSESLLYGIREILKSSHTKKMMMLPRRSCWAYTCVLLVLFPPCRGISRQQEKKVVVDWDGEPSEVQPTALIEEKTAKQTAISDALREAVAELKREVAASQDGLRVLEQLESLLDDELNAELKKVVVEKIDNAKSLNNILEAALSNIIQLNLILLSGDSIAQVVISRQSTIADVKKLVVSKFKLEGKSTKEFQLVHGTSLLSEETKLSVLEAESSETLELSVVLDSSGGVTPYPAPEDMQQLMEDRAQDIAGHLPAGAPDEDKALAPSIVRMVWSQFDVQKDAAAKSFSLRGDLPGQLVGGYVAIVPDCDADFSPVGAERDSKWATAMENLVALKTEEQQGPENMKWVAVRYVPDQHPTIPASEGTLLMLVLVTKVRPSDAEVVKVLGVIPRSEGH